MKVIAISTQKFVNPGRLFGQTATIKGSIYTVINVLPANEVIKQATLPQNIVPQAGDWYELLETHGWHYHGNFLTLPDDLFDSEVEEEQRVQYN